MSAYLIRAREGIDATSRPPDGIGAKARGLALAMGLGLPVPPVALVCCALGDDAALERDALEALRLVEAATGCALGDPASPLVVSVRSSVEGEAPGALLTALDVGVTEVTLPSLAARLGSEAAALDVARRALAARANLRGERVGSGLDAARGDGIRGRMSEAGRPSEEALRREIAAYGGLAALPVDARSAFLEAVRAVASRAARAASAEVCLLVQAMVFGDADGASGAAVVTSRHPVTGDPALAGEWVLGRQGDDLTGGRAATPTPVSARGAGRREAESLERQASDAYAAIGRWATAIEEALGDIASLEITVERGVPWLLQAERARLSPRAVVRVAADRIAAGTLSAAEALARVDVTTLAEAGARRLDDDGALERAGTPVIARGLVAGLGVGAGRAALTPEALLARVAEGAAASPEPWILLRPDASPDDAPAVRAAAGVVTSSGGLTSHAAVMCRALGRPCVVSATALRVDERAGIVWRGSEVAVREGEWVTVDGTDGRLVRGRAEPRWRASAPGADVLVQLARAALGATEDEDALEVYDRARRSAAAEGPTQGPDRAEGRRLA